jgi:hypothetical protein
VLNDSSGRRPISAEKDAIFASFILPLLDSKDTVDSIDSSIPLSFLRKICYDDFRYRDACAALGGGFDAPVSGNSLALLPLHYPLNGYIVIRPSIDHDDRVLISLLSYRPTLSLSTLFEIQTSTRVRDVAPLDCTDSLSELKLKGLKSFHILAFRCHSHVSIVTVKCISGHRKKGVFAKTIDTISFSGGDRPAHCSWRQHEKPGSFIGLLELAIVTLSGNVYLWTADFCSLPEEVNQKDDRTAEAERKDEEEEQDEGEERNEKDDDDDDDDEEEEIKDGELNTNGEELEQYDESNDVEVENFNDNDDNVVDDDDIEGETYPQNEDENGSDIVDDDLNRLEMKRKKRRLLKEGKKKKQTRRRSLLKSHSTLVLVPNSLVFAYRDVSTSGSNEGRLETILDSEKLPIAELSTLPTFLRAESLFSSLRRCGFCPKGKTTKTDKSSIWTIGGHTLVNNLHPLSLNRDDDENHGISDEHQPHVNTLFDTFDFPPSLAWMERALLEGGGRHMRLTSSSIKTNPLPSSAVLSACGIQIDDELIDVHNKPALTKRLIRAIQRLIVVVTFSTIYIVDLAAPVIPLLQLDNPMNGLAARLLTATILSTSVDIQHDAKDGVSDVLKPNETNWRGKSQSKVNFSVRVFSANISHCKLVVADIDFAVTYSSHIRLSGVKGASLPPLITCSLRSRPRTLRNTLSPPSFVFSTSVLNGIASLRQRTTSGSTRNNNQLDLLLSFSNGELVLIDIDKETATNVESNLASSHSIRTELLSASFPNIGAPVSNLVTGRFSKRFHASSTTAVSQIDVDTIIVDEPEHVDVSNQGESDDIEGGTVEDRVQSSFLLDLSTPEYQKTNRTIYVNFPKSDEIRSLEDKEKTTVSSPSVDLSKRDPFIDPKVDDKQAAEMDRGLEALAAVTFPLISRREAFLGDVKLAPHVHPSSYSDFGVADGLGISILRHFGSNQSKNGVIEAIGDSSRRVALRTVLGPQLVGLVGSSTKGNMKTAASLLIDLIEPFLIASTTSREKEPIFRSIDPRYALNAGISINASLRSGDRTDQQPISRKNRLTKLSLLKAWKSTVQRGHIDSILGHVEENDHDGDGIGLLEHATELLTSFDKFDGKRRKTTSGNEDKVDDDDDEYEDDDEDKNDDADKAIVVDDDDDDDDDKSSHSEHSLLLAIRKTLQGNSPLTLHELTYVLRLQPHFAYVTYKEVIDAVYTSLSREIRTLRLRCLQPPLPPHKVLHTPVHTQGSIQSKRNLIINAIRERKDPNVRFVLSISRGSITPVERVSGSLSVSKNSGGAQDALWSGVFKSVISKRLQNRVQKRKRPNKHDLRRGADDDGIDENDDDENDKGDSSDDSIEKNPIGRPKGPLKPSSLLSSLFSFEEPTEGTCWIVRTRGDLASAYWKRRGFSHNPFRSKTRKSIAERELEPLSEEAEAAIRKGLRRHLAIKAWDEIVYPMPNFHLAPVSASSADATDYNNDEDGVNEEALSTQWKKTKTKKKGAKYSVSTLGIYTSHYEAVLAASEAYAFGVCAWSFVKDIPPLIFSEILAKDDDPLSMFIKKKREEEHITEDTASFSSSSQPPRIMQVEAPCLCHMPLSLSGSEFPCESSACLLPNLFLFSLGAPNALPPLPSTLSFPFSKASLPPRHILGNCSFSAHKLNKSIKDPSFKVLADEVDEEGDPVLKDGQGPSFAERFFHKKTIKSRFEVEDANGEGIDRRKHGGSSSGGKNDDEDEEEEMDEDGEDEDESGLAAEEEQDRFMALLGLQPASSSQTSLAKRGPSELKKRIMHEEKEEYEEDDEYRQGDADDKKRQRTISSPLVIWPASAQAFIDGKLSEEELSSNYSTALDSDLWISSGKIEATLRSRGPGSSRKFKGPASVHPDKSSTVSETMVAGLKAQWNQAYHHSYHSSANATSARHSMNDDVKEEEEEEEEEEDYVDEEKDQEDGDQDRGGYFSRLSQMTQSSSQIPSASQLVSSLSSSNRLNRASSSLRVRIMAPN